MSLLFLATAEAAHAAAETGIIDKFGLQVNYVVIQAVSFLIVMAVLYRFAIKPTIVTMDERATKIESGLKYAEEMRAKLDATQQESAAIVKQAQSKTIEEARAEIARLVVATTERVLAKKLTDADRAAYNESAARELNVV